MTEALTETSFFYVFVTSAFVFGQRKNKISKSLSDSRLFKLYQTNNLNNDVVMSKTCK